MTLILLLFVSGFICGLIDHKSEEAKQASTPREIATVYDVKKAERERKQAAKKAQAAEDQAFFERKLPILREMLDAANDSLAHAMSSLEYAELANRESGAAVVSGKQIAAYRKERENALKQIMKIESQIHAAETKIEKAKFIVNYGG